METTITPIVLSAITPITGKKATDQDKMLLRYIPPAGSGVQISLATLVERYGSSPAAMRQLLWRIHAKGFVAIEHSSGKADKFWCQRTAAAELVLNKRSPGRPLKPLVIR